MSNNGSPFRDKDITLKLNAREAFIVRKALEKFAKLSTGMAQERTALEIVDRIMYPDKDGEE